MKTEYVDTALFLEAHFVHGLKPLVLEELRQRLGHTLRLSATGNSQVIRFGLTADFDALNQTQTVKAFYLGRHFAIPRPKALLGHQHFQLLLNQIALVRQWQVAQPFHSFRLHAAGSDSTTFKRLRQQISPVTALVDDPEAGDLVIRAYPEPSMSGHWTVLCRLTPRPLASRDWRVVDVPGGLNATIAAAAMRLSRPKPTDHFLNLMCGSGGLLIERLRMGCAPLAMGCDTSPTMLAAAQCNIDAAGLAGQIRLLQEDATRTSFPAARFDLLAADLPWGQLIGDHAKNELLYPLLLREAARIARPAARFVLITTEAQLLERSLQEVAQLWQLCTTLKLEYKNVRPRIYLLQRR